MAFFLFSHLLEDPRRIRITLGEVFREAHVDTAIFFFGGNGDGQHFRDARDRYGPFRLAVLPIGAYEPRWFMRDMHMNPAESVKALRDCGAQFALGHHYGTFQLTDEAIDAPANALYAALDEAGVPRERFVALKPGQAVEI